MICAEAIAAMRQEGSHTLTRRASAEYAHLIVIKTLALESHPAI